MITNISIKNYKSVVDLSLPLGRFNLLIGANGCGKSNVLEGIAMGAAASAGKLDYEYFANRGIRVVEPRFMLPAFEDLDPRKISVKVISSKQDEMFFDIHYDKDAKPARWVDDSINFKQLVDILELRKPKKISSVINMLKEMKDDTILNIRIRQTEEGFAIIPPNPAFDQFLIYSLEESELRKADNSQRTYPLGRHGEGLFAYLKELSQRENAAEIFNEITENLKVLDWFDNMEIAPNQLSSENNIRLHDSYLSDTLNAFDQRSTNEGFLYLLFYLTLIISDETPQLFAIENIDTAFNPKLCREVTKRLIELCRKHDKQMIATTHNAAVLDGMNLYEDDVRLHVIRRTIDGYTKANRVTLKGEMSMSLSEAWVKGLIGGLPDNF